MQEIRIPFLDTFPKSLIQDMTRIVLNSELRPCLRSFTAPESV